MAVAHSSLSTAIKGFADYLARTVPSGITVSVDTPQKAETIAKDLPNLDTVNIFVYRISPSGFHADTSQNEPTYVRLSVLITAFPRKDAEKDTDLRVLGHAMAVLQSAPEIPDIFPADPPDPNLHPDTTYYRLQAALQAPTMEELNHIWTTQGGELAYRLSAVYELSLIPIEPLSYVAPPVPVSAAMLDVSPTSTPGFSNEAQGIAPPDAARPWVPAIMIKGAGDELLNARTVAAGVRNLDVLITGEDGTRIEIVTSWTRQDGTTDETVLNRRIQTSQFDGTGARFRLRLGDKSAGDVAQIFARHRTHKELESNRVTVTVEAGP